MRMTHLRVALQLEPSGHPIKGCEGVCDDGGNAVIIYHLQLLIHLRVTFTSALPKVWVNRSITGGLIDKPLLYLVKSPRPPEGPREGYVGPNTEQRSVYLRGSIQTKSGGLD